MKPLLHPASRLTVLTHSSLVRMSPNITAYDQFWALKAKHWRDSNSGTKEEERDRDGIGNSGVEGSGKLFKGRGWNGVFMRSTLRQAFEARISINNDGN